MNYISYSLSELSNYDLDGHILVLGTARVGKSTLTLQIARRYYSNKYQQNLQYVDTSLIQSKWYDSNIIYSREQGFSPLKNNKKEFIQVDDAVLLADKRGSMLPDQSKFLGKMNFYASNNNLIATLIQNLADLDSRLYSKANLVIIVYERGKALVYAKPKNFPIVRDTFDFDFIQKHTYLLNQGERRSLYNLKRIRSYIGEIRFKSLADNPLYKKYLQKKSKEQKDLD